ncbi:hypothetical protein NMG60_11002128 [Bertholletia excelsa]
MAASICPTSTSICPCSTTVHLRGRPTEHSNSCVSLILRSRNNGVLGTRRSKRSRAAPAMSDVSTVADPAQAEVTWQIVAGALAGVTPFVVAGIEFGKRIAAQRKCERCGGSGLVMRDNKYYFRCPSCGGFLPWQSWKRFFTG